MNQCPCGNNAEPDESLCGWCQTEAFYEEVRNATGDHCTVEVSRITGDVVCVECSRWCDCLICSNPEGGE